MIRLERTFESPAGDHPQGIDLRVHNFTGVFHLPAQGRSWAHPRIREHVRTRTPTITHCFRTPSPHPCMVLSLRLQAALSRLRPPPPVLDAVSGSREAEAILAWRGCCWFRNSKACLRGRWLGLSRSNYGWLLTAHGDDRAWRSCFCMEVA